MGEMGYRLSSDYIVWYMCVVLLYVIIHMHAKKYCTIYIYIYDIWCTSNIEYIYI